jgi:CheY-like chemotaxis protein
MKQGGDAVKAKSEENEEINASGERRSWVDPQSVHSPDYRPVVVVVTGDMMLSIRLQDAVDRSGGRPALVDSGDAAADAIDQYFPVLVLLDLAVGGDWATAIRRCKLRPHTRQIPIYAFGSHVDAATLRAAREAGADHAWARSRMMEDLVDVVARHVDPPVRYPAGWDDVLSERARAGLDEFNRGDYYEQHELLEEAWMEERRPIREMYQGILQVGVAFYQIEQGNWAGSLKMFRRGLPKLRGLPDVCQGVNLAAFRQDAEIIHAEIVRLGPKGIGTFDCGRFPRIEMAE